MPDLSIKYNNEVIGELDNSGTAMLKTTGKKCVSDIEVEYTKTPTGMTLPSFTINDSTGEEVAPNLNDGVFIIDVGNPNIITGGFGVGGPNAKYYIVPKYDNRTSHYKMVITIYADNDIYNVSVNGNSVAFTNDMYSWLYDSDTYPGDITVTVTAK